MITTGEAARRLSELLPQRVNPRSQAQVARFFDGLELIEPGVVPIQQWRPASDDKAAAPAALWSGVARHLAWLRDETGDAFAAGIILHAGPHVFPVSDRIIAAPVSALWA